MTTDEDIRKRMDGLSKRLDGAEIRTFEEDWNMGAQVYGILADIVIMSSKEKMGLRDDWEKNIKLKYVSAIRRYSTAA